MQPLVNELLSLGYSVQLRHTETETSFADDDVHGYVLLQTADGKDIVRQGGFQHNRKLRSGGAWDPSAVAALCEKVKAAFTESAPVQKTSAKDAVASAAEVDCIPTARAA